MNGQDEKLYWDDDGTIFYSYVANPLLKAIIILALIRMIRSSRKLFKWNNKGS